LLFGLNVINAADDDTTLGLIPFLHNGTVGMIAGGLLFLALAVVLARAGRKTIA
jgi:hypothetical protein